MDLARARRWPFFEPEIVATTLAVGVAYYAGSVIGLSLRPSTAVTSVLWPPNAIVTAALLVTPLRRWPAALMGVLPAHVLAQAPLEWPWSMVLLLYGTNCSEALIGATLLRILSDAPTRFDTIRRYGAFVCAAVVLGPLLSTFADAAVVSWLHGDVYWTVWWRRFPSNVLTQITVTPAIVGVIVGARAWLRSTPEWRYAEAASLAACLVASGWVAFGAPLGSGGILPQTTDTALVVQLPLVLWAALRFGPVGTSLALLGTTLVSGWALVQGRAVALPVPADQLILNVQTILIATGVTLLALATLIEERRRSMHALGERFRFEKLLSEFSRAFVQVTSERMNAVCHEWLQRLGTFLGVECVRLFQVVEQETDIVLVSEWREPGYGLSPPLMARRDFPWTCERIFAHGAVAISDIAMLPPAAAVDRASFEANGYKAVLVLPLLAGERLIGALAFVSFAERAWPDESISNLRLLSEVLANALARRRIDDALMRSEVMKSAILDSLASGVAVIDADGYLLNVNTHWTRLAEESRIMPYAPIREGDQILDVFPSDAVAGVKAVLTRARARFTNEYVTVGSGGTKWWLLAVSRLNRAEGGAVVTLADITEQRRAEIEAQQVRQELAHVSRVSTMGELTASLAHQLNQPLTGVVINAQAARRIIDRVPLDYDELRETMIDILADARRASEVIQRVRGLLRRGEFEMTPVDLQSIITDVANLVSSDALIRNITISLDLDPQSIMVRGDRVQLQQVVLNLLVNAMEAIGKTHAERMVRVSCRRTERGDARVIVHDSGVGLAEGAEGRVFDPFYTTKPNGMGMGLSIAQSIVEVHGGSIKARNAAQGTIVEFMLPLDETPELV